MAFDKIKDLKPSLNDSENIEVTIYQGLLYHVIPNPNDQQKRESAEATYRMGHYISKFTKTIRKTDFDNPLNWNS
jgi:hypothetical protein